MSGKSKATIELEEILGFDLSDIAEAPSAFEQEVLVKTSSLLDQYTVPKPLHVDTKALIGAVRTHLPKPVKPRFRTKFQAPVPASVRLLEILRPQIAVLALPFWITSALVVTLGVILTSQMPEASMVPLLLLAPLVAALGVAYAFRSVDERVLELEMTCAMSWQQLSLARLIIILGYDIVLLLAASLATISFRPSSGLVQLVISWLAPLLLWAAISLFTSLRLGYYFGVIASFATWSALVLFGIAFPKFSLWNIVNTPGGLVARGVLIIGTIICLGSLVVRISRPTWAKAHLGSK